MGSRRPFPTWLILRIGERDGWKCHVDEDGYRPNDPWEIDHNVAVARGGTNHVTNLKLCHRNCNRDKGAA